MMEALDREAALATMRQDIITRISYDPFCPIARLIADALNEVN